MGVYLRRTLVVRENERLCGIEGKGWESKDYNFDPEFHERLREGA